jgi:hypothetical protein
MYFKILIIFTFFMPLPSYAGLFGPSTYDECILDSMRGVTSDVAARLVARSCREQFLKSQEKTPKASALSQSQLIKVTGRAGGNAYFSGSLYNGNKSLVIIEITIKIITTISGNDVSRSYTEAVNIGPQKTSSFGFSIIAGDKDADQSWYIESAKGYKP